MPAIAPLDLAGHCLAAAFLGEVPVFALADGSVHRLADGLQTSQLHDGLACAAIDRTTPSLVTGGEDGRILRLSASGNRQELAQQADKWINCIACGPRETVAWASGSTVVTRAHDGTIWEAGESRTVEGLAFAPKGLRVAAARYGGVSLHWVGTSTAPKDLEWKGAHTGVTFSPNGKYVVSSMLENALHGWRLKDGKHMRMTGYPAKVKSLSWSVGSKWLASSGAPAAIVWPFAGKDGPMDKAPLELGTRSGLMVSCVACHPTDEVVAIGYTDGMIVAARFSDLREVILRSDGKGAITTLDWHDGGVRLAFGSEAGDCGVIDISA